MPRERLHHGGTRRTRGQSRTIFLRVPRVLLGGEFGWVEKKERRSRRPPPVASSESGAAGYLTCLLTSLVISNMLTCALPPNTALSASSDLIIRLFFESCSLFFLMYAHSFLVSSVRGSGFGPTTSDSTPSGVTGFMKAALGFLLLFAMSSPCEGTPGWAPRSCLSGPYYEQFSLSVPETNSRIVA